MMKGDDRDAFSGTPFLGRKRFFGHVIIPVLASLAGFALLLLLVNVWRKQALGPPEYVSFAKLIARESPTAGSQTQDLRQWVIDTLLGPVLKERAQRRIHALRFKFPSQELDVFIKLEKEPRVLNIFVVTKDAKSAEIYLEAMIDELMMMRSHSPVLGELAILLRPSTSIPCPSWIRRK